MNPELEKYIQTLSTNDTKGLLGKTLKATEELGELSKKVLPFENQAGTLHRFVDKEAILEECADVLLCIHSIAHNLGYSYSDLESMIRHKATDWQELQSKESKVEFPIPFEIHVTVEVISAEEDESSNRFMINSFKGICSELGVKPIIINLENGGETIMQDVMTSSHFFGDNSGAFYESERIKERLIRNGFKVSRVKIETVPWHPAAPQKQMDKMPVDCYFEAHIGCIITEDQKKKLQDYASQYDAIHLSRNPFKKMEDGKFVNMLTLRMSNCFDTFQGWLGNTCAELDIMGIEYGKVISEFAIYDTKVHHDFIWTKKETVTA